MLIAVIPLGVAGAACATAAGYVLQSVIGMIFFFANRKGSLYLVRPKFDGKALLKACSNGMSEMVGMPAITVTMIVPSVTASAMTLLMYIGEMILLNGHLYSLGNGALFTSLPKIVLSFVDIAVIAASGCITALIFALIRRRLPHPENR